ncbi:MAG: acylneuraminate cytidylyltransferase family protein [bacterium]|nr:acylneuraminate cytidylyltransferase family protein [bacterium]MDZ4299401.1 acylneuraminate cytidylyltransferase family protein [Candidatus Sungbacteria bacterium]
MYNHLTILALIPARGGSKGIPKKNIKPLAGRPLIAHSIVVALASRVIDRTIVSTDSEEIVAVAREWGAEVPFIRPAELAEDLTPDMPVFEHCLWWLKENEGYEPDVIVHLRPTGPLRTAEEIDEAIELLAACPDADSIRSVEPPPKSPYKMWMPDGKYIRPFTEIAGLKDAHTMPRQILPKVYQTTADIGVLRRTTVTEKKSVIGDRVLPYVLRRPTVDIDTPFDFVVAELLLAQEHS